MIEYLLGYFYLASPEMRKILAIIGAFVTGGLGVALVSSIQSAHAQAMN
jgi:hypothetical protein